jgi:hypothetical protein
MYDFNPVIFQKRRDARFVPRDMLRRIFEFSFGRKFAVGKSEIKRIIFRRYPYVRI